MSFTSAGDPGIVGPRVGPIWRAVGYWRSGSFQKSSFFPQIIHLLIGFSIMFTIHFGVPLGFSMISTIHFGGVYHPYFWVDTHLTPVQNVRSFCCTVSIQKLNGTETQRTLFSKLLAIAIRYSVFFRGPFFRGSCWRFLGPLDVSSCILMDSGLERSSDGDFLPFKVMGAH